MEYLGLKRLLFRPYPHSLPGEIHTLSQDIRQTLANTFNIQYPEWWSGWCMDPETGCDLQATGHKVRVLIGAAGWF